MEQILFFPGYESHSSATSLPSRKGKIKKKRRTFRLNKNELFHRDLYGEIPQPFSTPLPVQAPYCGETPTRLVPFNEAYANKDYNCTVHFFIDDFLFIRVLRNPKKYLDFFKKCHSVIGTDLSQYADMSAEDRYFCAYINSAFTAYLQRNGVNMISNVTWSLPDSYAYSWTSIPRHSVIAINCKGILKHDLSKYLWYRGYEEAVSTLQPSLIVRYGTKMPGEYTSISIYFENERLKYMRYGR
jgi:hypothetical protein